MERDGETFELSFSNHASVYIWETSEDRTVIESGTLIHVTDTYQTEIIVKKSGGQSLTVQDRELAAELAEKFCGRLLRKHDYSAFDNGIFFPAKKTETGYWRYSEIC